MSVIQVPGGARVLQHFKEVKMPYNLEYLNQLQNETITSFGEQILSDAYGYIRKSEALVRYTNKYIDSHDPNDLLTIVWTIFPDLEAEKRAVHALWDNEDVQRILQDNESAKIYGEIEGLIQQIEDFDNYEYTRINRYVYYKLLNITGAKDY